MTIAKKSVKKTPQKPKERAWDGVCHREFDFEVKAVNVEERSIDVVASTDTMDAHGDVVEQDWDLKRYLVNPVILFNHNRFDSSPYSMGGAVDPKALLPLGRGENTRVEGGKLKTTIIFASDDGNPFAGQIFHLFKEKILRAVSVGFKPGEVTLVDKDSKRPYYRLSKCELREISVVPIGSNPDAVAKSIEFERSHLALMAPNDGASPQKESTMTDEEMQKAIDDQRVAKAVAEKAAEEAIVRAKALEQEVAAEKALNAKLETDLAAERAANVEAQKGLVAAALDSRQGVKFAPAEREDLEALAKDIGLERVIKLIDVRIDLAVSKAVEVNGKRLSHGGNAPAPVGGGGTEDLVKEVDERTAK
jgi:hypothetical protein